MKQETLEAQISTVSCSLRDSLLALLSDLPNWPCGPQGVSDAFGIDKVLTSRLLSATRNPDPLITVHRMPGPEPLRRLLRAAADRGWSSERIDEAEAAVDRFDRLIREEIGGRSQLDSVLSSMSREARETYEARHKQWTFKGMSHLLGYASDIEFVGAFLQPSDDPDLLDDVDIIGSFGLRRLRPGVTIKFSSRFSWTDAPDAIAEKTSPRRALDGSPVSDTEAARLDQFCTAPPATLAMNREDGNTYYTLAGDTFGMRDPADLLIAVKRERSLPRHSPEDTVRRTGIAANVEQPTRLLVADVFLHRELVAGYPELRIYDTTIEGTANPNDPTRDVDQFDLLERIEHIGRGLAAFRSSDVPNYRELVQHVFESTNWDPDAFELYRTRIEYPVYGSQAELIFDRPAR